MGVLVGKIEGRPVCRQDNNTEMDLREIGCGYGLDWYGSG
jgi:hypothetical protein